MSETNPDLEATQTELTGKKPKRGSTRITSLSDLTLPESNGTTAQEERESRLDRADRDAIDTIVLSNDVSKGGKIRVSRKGPMDHTYQYITTIPADAWATEGSFEFIKKVYGGGDYKCMTFRANGQMYKPFEFSIDYRCKGQLDEDEIKRLAAEQQSNGRPAGNSEFLKMFEILRADMKPKDDGLKSSDLIRIMEMSSQKSDQMMMLMMQMNAKASENMVQMMTVMMTAQSSKSGTDPVILQMLQAKQEKTPVMELLDIMRAVKELNAPEKEEEDKPLWERLLTSAAPALLGSLTGGQALPAQPQVQSQVQAQTTAQEQTTEIDQRTANMLQNYMVRLFLGKVLQAASENRDPALYADMIMETLEPAQLDMLRRVLTQADWAVKLFGEDQRVQTCMAWLVQLKELILSDVSEQPTAGAAATTPTGSSPTV